MRRKRSQNSDDSLDMLLDTITNTFGGIVFLAMLIVILLGSSRPSSPDPSLEAAFQSIRSQIETLKQQKVELEQLQTAGKIVSSLVEVDADPQSIAKAKSLAQQHSQLQEQLHQQVSARLQLAERIRQSAEQAHARALETTNLETKFESLSAEVDKEIKSRSREIDLPKERPTSKQQFVILVQNSKVFELDGEPQVPGMQINSRDFESCSRNDAIVVLDAGPYRIRSAGGMPMSDENDLRRALNRVNNSRVYVTVAIWEDSYEHFSGLRKIFKDLKLEYQLILMEPDEIISESPQATAPRVQ